MTSGIISKLLRKRATADNKGELDYPRNGNTEELGSAAAIQAAKETLMACILINYQPTEGALESLGITLSEDGLTEIWNLLYLTAQKKQEIKHMISWH